MTPWERFAAIARGRQADRLPVALIVDSPWLPGYAGIDTLDYFLRDDEWLRINCRAQAPAFREIVPNHFVSCHRAEELKLLGIA